MADAPSLWACIDALGGEDDDLSLGRAFVAHPDHARDYWCAEKPLQAHRCQTGGLGGLAGMRLLHRLRSCAEGRLEVWPFDGTEVRSPAQLSAVLGGMGAGVPENLPRRCFWGGAYSLRRCVTVSSPVTR